MTTMFDDAIATVQRLQPMAISGAVSEVRGLTVLVGDLPLPVGAMVDVEIGGENRPGEVVGFDEAQTIIMLLGTTDGIRRGDRVVGRCASSLARVGSDLLGRVVDAMGRPIDGGGPIRQTVGRPLYPAPLEALGRVPIDEALGTGVRAIDGVLTTGRGQRLGIFSGPGVGKSSLLGQMARNTEADVSVIALVGERGREVNDFLHHALGPEGLKRSVVVVATGDEPVLMRIRAAHYALSVAEHFRDHGQDVVLLMDSITRFCQAQRQVGLAIGEPPATKGFTPSVFAMLPGLLERCGRAKSGSITGFFAVLVEGDDLTEPISDACRGVLDGHIVLTRDLANRGHWPAIDVLQSISRLANTVSDPTQNAARRRVLRVLADYRQVEDLVNIGAYAAGSNPNYDLAIAMHQAIETFLTQGLNESAAIHDTQRQLAELALQIESQARRQTSAAGRMVVPGPTAAG